MAITAGLKDLIKEAEAMALPEQRAIRPDPFGHACLMRLEGIASKHKNRPCRAGRCPHWIKVKDLASPAMNRAQMAVGDPRSLTIRL